ncbi:uncharacterized protein METZ01_LOCUS97575 [marine metagenome]|uniref:Uncharacterized protein n=1 Tax=marine metagenome TaxID=408172 RepID=A0A381VX93_9ZZZZ
MPQHIGDLMRPQPSGHSDVATTVPSSFTTLPGTRLDPQFPQVSPLTDMSQLWQWYLVIPVPSYGCI